MSAAPNPYPSLRPVSATGLITAIAVLLVLAAVGITCTILIFAPGYSIAARILLAMAALPCLALPGYITTVITTVAIRRYLRTGDFLASPEERLARRLRWQSPRFIFLADLVVQAAALFWVVMIGNYAWAFVTNPAHRMHDAYWTIIGVLNLTAFWRFMIRPIRRVIAMLKPEPTA
jgi:hypothetical protein